MGKVKVVHLFSGVGAPEMALKKLKIQTDFVGFSEIDKYAIQSYQAIHGKDIPNLGSIIDIKELPYCDLLIYGSPCQDFSIAGLQKGMIDENGQQTRSGLLLEVERLLDIAKQNDKLPNVLLMENVKNLVGKKFKPDFDRWLNKLEELGYNNYWQVLNAKDYGVPQNRERVFVVSIRKDVDEQIFKFPEKFELKIRLKDVLEENVDESFYISEKQIEKILNSNFNQEATRIQGDICQTLLARDYKDPKCVKIDNKPRTQKVGKNLYPNSGNPQAERFYRAERLGGLFDEPNQKHQAGSIWDKEALAPTLDTMQGGYRQPLIIDDTYANREPREYAETCPTIRTDKVIIGSTQKHAAINKEGICPTLTSAMGTGGGHVPMHNYDIRIRKLTPKECWRLMGFSDEDFKKAKASGISNTQLYKQAGNSIVVDVLYYIFKEIYQC